MPKIPKRKREPIPKEYKFDTVKWTRVPAKHSHTLKDPRSSQTRVRITMYVDLDVLNYFKELASEAGAAPYQRQMQMALRRAMERGEAKGSAKEYSQLLADDAFIGAVAERVKSLKNKANPRSG